MKKILTFVCGVQLLKNQILQPKIFRRQSERDRERKTERQIGTHVHGSQWNDSAVGDDVLSFDGMDIEANL